MGQWTAGGSGDSRLETVPAASGGTSFWYLVKVEGGRVRVCVGDTVKLDNQERKEKN